MIGSRRERVGVAAVAVAALVAAGAAVAASKLQGSTPSARDDFGTALASYGAGSSHGAGPGDGFGVRRHGGDELQAAADYLGLSVGDLLTQLQSGKTLAQIADATNGKSAAGLIDALVKHEQAELAQAVKD